MGNYYKPVIYVGINISRNEFFKQMKFEDYDEFFEWVETQKLDLNGHKSLINKFGFIYTDDEFICIGLVINASGEKEDYPNHLNLIEKYNDVKLFVSEKLRLLKINIGTIELWNTTLWY